MNARNAKTSHYPLIKPFDSFNSPSYLLFPHFYTFFTCRWSLNHDFISFFVIFLPICCYKFTAYLTDFFLSHPKTTTDQQQKKRSWKCFLANKRRENSRGWGEKIVMETWEVSLKSLFYQQCGRKCLEGEFWGFEGSILRLWEKLIKLLKQFVKFWNFFVLFSINFDGILRFF